MSPSPPAKPAHDGLPRVDSGVSHDPSQGGPKQVGAYYTPLPVARALAAWALRHAQETVLDPAAGDGVFLAAAADRLDALGGSDCSVVGVELRDDAAAAARARLTASNRPCVRLRVADFLALHPADLGRFDAVLGNPPFVRYQRLSATRRRLGAARAAEAGVELGALASSWAAFAIHAVAFLKPGGRLAMVLPLELGHAAYARPVIALLRRRFASVAFVLPQRALFPRLDQGALLLLADGLDEPFRAFGVAGWAPPADGEAHDPRSPGELARLRVTPLDAAALAAGRAKLHHGALPPDAAALLAELARRADVARLDALASVSIGYVTGANGFFHLSPNRAAELELEARHLRPALFRSRALRGLAFTHCDWSDGCADGSAGYLFLPGSSEEPAVRAYLAHGDALGVPQGTKARQRSPWFRVTRAAPPDMALTPMANRSLRLALNEAGAVVSNTLYAVGLRRGALALDGRVMALAMLTSLGRASAEVEGHALGGGLLKLEPAEARAVLLPLPAAGGRDGAQAATAVAKADAALRAGDSDEATRLADEALLEPLVGREGVDVLAGAARVLGALRRGG